MEYEGMGLHKDYPKGRKAGKITVSTAYITFDDGEKSVQFPMQDTELTLGGAGNRYIYFNYPGKPEWSFYTDNKKIIRDPAIKSRKADSKDVKKIKRQRLVFWSIIGTLSTIFIGLFVAYWIFRPQIIEAAANMVPISWEQEAGEELFALAVDGKDIIEDDSLYLELSKITDPLVNEVENKEYKFEFFIVEDETLNAFALPGGYVVIHSGLILKADNAEEVAGVLAHEISHVTRRHHVRSIIAKQLNYFTLFRIIIGDSGGIIGSLSGLGGYLESLAYSREFETESDETGWELLLRANIDPRGMIGFFRKLQEEYGEDDGGYMSFMSTHPATGERIGYLEDKADDLEKADLNKIDINFDAFQQRLQDELNIR